MTNTARSDLAFIGLGVTSAVAIGKTAFSSALMEGAHAFAIMEREGRQRDSSYMGAEIGDLPVPERLSKRLLRTASYSARVALVTLLEAWEDAGLDAEDPARIGLIVGGSNVQQRELLSVYAAPDRETPFISPTYGISFMDSDLCGLCTEQFGIRGWGSTVGGASASGQLAVIQAAQTVLAGQTDVCIALGALMDLSWAELRAFDELGAMGSFRFNGQPGQACRPFDEERDGFLYGEGCGAVVVARADWAAKRGKRLYGTLAGWGVSIDGNRNPNPSVEGEAEAIGRALASASIHARDIGYVNPHGTGSRIGDEVELQALMRCGLEHSYINATKSITGHGLTSAGAIETIATLLQMRESCLHPTRNLERPIRPDFNWVRSKPATCRVKHSLNVSVGFGGINTAVVISQA